MGQFLLSVPSGLCDQEDLREENPLFAAAVREIEEETGLHVSKQDTLEIVNPCLFSTPGLSDESTALIRATLHLDADARMTDANTCGTEVMKDFSLITKEEAKKILRDGRDQDGIFYSIATWTALAQFAFF